MKNLKAFKLLLALLIVIASTNCIFGQSKIPTKYKELYAEKMNRSKWFRDARFGMFIHYGPYAVAARGEWVKSNEKMTTKDYQKYVDAFVPSNYKPKEWAQLAAEAGMKYAVMTAKHHDGFCMFNSKLTDYKISSNTGRDFVAEYLDAFREKGLKVGLYYSLIDWHHNDYPHVGNHPLNGIDSLKKEVNWDNYIKYMHQQVEELMSNYGKIDILWLDYSFDQYNGEKWKADELVKMIRKHQPDIILNSRLELNHNSSAKGRNYSGYGDFETPEQSIPEQGIKDIYGQDIAWETCLTLNNNWGYTAADNDWKSAKIVVHSLVDVVSKNGNLLLNVGPDSQGNIPIQSQQILKEVGKWMNLNSESIYGCGKCEIQKPDWGYYTQKDNTVYAHWTNPKIGYINIKYPNRKIEKVNLLYNGQQAATASSWWGNQDSGNFFVNIKQPIHFSYELPDQTNTVFKIIIN